MGESAVEVVSSRGSAFSPCRPSARVPRGLVERFVLVAAFETVAAALTLVGFGGIFVEGVVS